MNIAACMKRHVVSIPASTTIREAAALFVKKHIGLLPVVDRNDKPVGVIGGGGCRPPRADAATKPARHLRRLEGREIILSPRSSWYKNFTVNHVSISSTCLFTVNHPALRQNGRVH
ncbi:MAG: hypothetical protein DPW15_09325 [Chloroflexi bacterium]|nr:hypothetical protein [Chloroflexota bacterium]